MSRIAQVLGFERVVEDGAQGADVKVDPGGGDATVVPHYCDAGDDSQPLPGDFVALCESSGGSGAEHVTGYADVRSSGKAAPGEKRIYARRANGTVACELWLQRDGSISIAFGEGGVVECKPSGDVVINGVVISKLGAISAPGEVTAMATTLPLSLTKHTHAQAAVGTPSSPVPFPYVPPTP